MKITTKQLTTQEMVDQGISKYTYINPRFFSEFFGRIGLNKDLVYYGAIVAFTVLLGTIIWGQ